MSVKKVEITRIRSDGSTETLEDSVASDVAVCIFVDGEFYRTLVASPGMLEELVVGHLYAEGVVSSPADIGELNVQPERVDVSLRHPVNLSEITMRKSRLLTTACAGFPRIRPGSVRRVKPVEDLDAALIHGVVDELNRLSTVFRETGGTHSALIHHMDDGFVAFAEDVGRHNALDKVIGRCLLDAVDLSRCVLASSGRLAGEMVLKAAAAGIPVVCSVSAPLMSGIIVAEEAGIRLVGFVRGRRMNLYA
jgi:FdhD protein